MTDEPAHTTDPNDSAQTGPSRPSVWGMVSPCATLFVSSACVMMVELLAFRMITRFLGQSSNTTAAIIGVVLAGLAVGNYVGGRIADLYPARPTLAALFVLASAVCFAIPALNNRLGDWPFLWSLPLPFRITLHVGLAFTLPAVFLGAISPVLAKMALDQGRQTGRTVGVVYAWGVVGSLFGTFMCGFLLLPYFGIYALNYVVSAVLAVMGVLYAGRHWGPYAWSATAAVLIVVALGPWSSVRTFAADLGLRDAEGAEIFFDKASRYSHVRVEAYPGEPGRRVMLLDKLAHSFYNPGLTEKLLYGYETVYDAVTEHASGGRVDLDALILGGGGYTHPRHFLRRRPDSRLDVVEIDPVVTEAARAAFGLEDDPRMRITHLDARQHVMQLVRRKRAGEPVPDFDFVFLDAVNDFNVPYHLTTVEFQRMVRELLAPDGVYLITLVDILSVGKFLGAEVHTTRQVFEHVDCFFANEAEPGSGLVPDDRNTFVIVASDRDLRLTDIGGDADADAMGQLLLSRQTLEELLARVPNLVLTDDYAPVEHLMTEVIERWAERTAPARFFNRGNRAEARGRDEEAAEHYLEAIELDPKFYLAYLNYGVLRYRQGKQDPGVRQQCFSEAVAAFARAAQLHPKSTSPRLNLGSLYLEAGMNEAAAGMNEAAADMNEAAVDWYQGLLDMRPDHLAARHGLGMALGRLGRFDECRNAFLAVLKLDPDYPDAAKNLAEVEAALARTTSQPTSAPQPSTEREPGSP